jgi:hypothetical protein
MAGNKGMVRGFFCRIRFDDQRDKIVLDATFQTDHKRKRLGLVLREKMRNALLEKTDQVCQVFDLKEVSRKMSMPYPGQHVSGPVKVSSLT